MDRERGHHEGSSSDATPTGGLVRIGSSARLALPAALGAALLIGAVALGATVLGSATDDKPLSPRAGDTAATGGGAVDGSDLGGGGRSWPAKPALEVPAGEPKDDSEASPKPGEPDPAPTKEVGTLKMELVLGDKGVVVEWSACDRDGLDVYKVIRSTDAYATWPLGKGDSLAGAPLPPPTRFVDGGATGGTFAYRVLGLGEVDGAFQLLCSSETLAIEVPKPTPEPTPKPTAEPTAKPTAKPTPKPTEEPAATTLELALALRDGRVLIDWSAYRGDGFAYYKVVRSMDKAVGWPMGEDDRLVTAIGDQEQSLAKDVDVAAGASYWYRVFAVAKSGDGYRVLAASPAKGITLPAAEPKPTPEPVAMWIEAEVTGEGVVLHWEACGGEGFRYTKVVRSTSSGPSYLPWKEGTQVIGVLEDPGVTSFVDHDVASGQTWWYRVQSIGVIDGVKVLLGQTPAIQVVIP